MISNKDIAIFQLGVLAFSITSFVQMILFMTNNITIGYIIQFIGMLAFIIAIYKFMSLQTSDGYWVIILLFLFFSVLTLFLPVFQDGPLIYFLPVIYGVLLGACYLFNKWYNQSVDQNARTSIILWFGCIGFVSSILYLSNTILPDGKTWWEDSEKLISELTTANQDSLTSLGVELLGMLLPILIILYAFVMLSVIILDILSAVQFVCGLILFLKIGNLYPPVHSLETHNNSSISPVQST